jgi:alkylation response protein AidB-like acyl-CoA dehydrogenase
MILSESQSLVADTARRFAEAELAPTAAARDRTGDFPTKILRRMGELGLMGVAVAEEWGGAGADYVSLTAAVEQIARGDGAIATIMSTHNSLACLPLVRHGTDSQKERFLVPLARGEHVGGFSITESQSGSNAADIRTRAVQRGDTYVLNGAKQLVTSGSDADTVMVFAATDPDQGPRGITCFIVQKGMPGFRVGRIEEKLGIRASGTAELILEDVEVPAENVLGDVGGGYRIALSSLGTSRIGISAQAVGLAQAALDAAVAYAKERESFGKPIIEHQAVAFRLADMAARIQAARQSTFHAACLADAGQPHHNESSMAKLVSAEMAERVCSDAIQVFGGAGYLADHPVERLYRDARICQIYEGTGDILRMVISRELMRQ